MITIEKTSPRITAMTPKATAMVIATSVASESMPSMKLTALMTPTIQITETTEPRMPRLNGRRRRRRRSEK